MMAMTSMTETTEERWERNKRTKEHNSAEKDDGLVVTDNNVWRILQENKMRTTVRRTNINVDVRPEMYEK